MLCMREQYITKVTTNTPSYLTLFGSFGARLVILLSTLTTVLIVTRALGIEAQGTIGLINFTMLLIAAISNFIGGGANVYLTSRLPFGSAFIPSLVWSIASTALVGIAALFVPLVPHAYLIHALLLGWLQALFTFLLQISLGRDRVNRYTAITALQALLSASFLAFFVLLLQWKSPLAFIASLYIAFGLTLVLSAADNWHYIKSARRENYLETSKQLFRYGKYAQGGNILHLINLRLPIVFLNLIPQTGLALAGVYSLLLYAAEAIWTVSKSLSIVLYSKVAKVAYGDQQSRKLTAHYSKYGLFVSSIACAVALVIPVAYYEKVFQASMADFFFGLALLIPGILANTVSIVLASYFSGRGEYFRNMWASALGLISTTATCFLFIPQSGILAAAGGASVAFFAQMAYFLYHFRRNQTTEN
jgi:O-antigen/teichoic acid export membrane protein